MSGPAKFLIACFTLFTLFYSFLKFPFNLQAQYMEPSLPPASSEPDPGTCYHGHCGSACECGSFFCETMGRTTYICCTPDCATGGTSSNRRCWQDPQCDNIISCSDSTDCYLDIDYYHQCGDLSGTDGCLVLPHCDGGACWFECRCGDSGPGGGPGTLPGNPRPSFKCQKPTTFNTGRLTDDTGQEGDITFKDLEIEVSDGSGIANLNRIYVGLWPTYSGGDIDHFPESSGPDQRGVSPTKYAYCGTRSNDTYLDETHLGDDCGSTECLNSWVDSGRPGFFGVVVYPNNAGNAATFRIANLNNPSTCPWGDSAASGDLSNATGTAVLQDLNDVTHIEPVDANTIKLFLRVQTSGEFSFHGSWDVFLMVRDDNGNFQYGHPAQWEISDCSIICATYQPNPPSLVSPADGASIDCFSSSQIFDWEETSSWGTDCVGQTGDDQYSLYVGPEEATLISPGNLQCSQSRASGTTQCEVDLNGLSQGTNYWTVVAENGDIDSGIPGPWSFELDNTAPTQPVPISPGGSTPGPHSVAVRELSMEWSHPDSDRMGCLVGGGTNNFIVATSETSESYDWGDPLCVTGEDEFSCGPFEFEWGTTYYWKVRASNNGLDFSDSSTYTDSEEFTFTPAPPAWWQAQGPGGIHADGDVVSEIPAAVPADNAYLMKGDNGIISYQEGGSLSAGEGSIAETHSWYIQSVYDDQVFDFDWWTSHLRDEEKLAFDGSNPTESGVYQASGTISTTGNWNLPASRWAVILIDGDFNINNQIIVNENGGFLMVVASGTVTIDPEVTQVEGIYIGQQINIASDADREANVYDEDPLNFEGTLVAWESLSLSRDIGLDNVDQASMVFTYRPDFILNAPSVIKEVFYTWSQIPG